MHLPHTVIIIKFSPFNKKYMSGKQYKKISLSHLYVSNRNSQNLLSAFQYQNAYIRFIRIL